MALLQVQFVFFFCGSILVGMKQCGTCNLNSAVTTLLFYRLVQMLPSFYQCIFCCGEILNLLSYIYVI